MRLATLLLAAVTILTPAAVLFPKALQRDVPVEVDSARSALKGAYADLQKAGGEWGGHRVKAMQHIQAAEAELNEAEKWAKEHHDMK